MFDLNSRQQKELLFFSCIALLFVFPIIHANIYFADDLTRSLEGYTAWEYNGRPLASVVQLILSASQPGALLDVAPLTQITAALLLALSAFQFNEYLNKEHQQGLVLASVLIIVNPFFLYNLSYRFDSFSMSLSVFLAVMAFCLPLKTKIGSKASVVVLIASLSLYQSNINIFIALAAIEVVLLSRQSDLRSIFNRLGIRAGQYSAACFIYFITIGQLFTYGSGGSRSRLVEFSLDGLASIIGNIDIFNNFWLSFFTPVNALFLAILVLFVLRDFDRTLQKSENRKVQIIALLIALSLYFISLWGPLILLQDANAGYRSMPSFYMFAPLLVVISSMTRERFSWAWLIALFLPIIISYQYGVAANSQRVYENRVSALVQYDLLNHHVANRPIYIIGSFKRAPRAELIGLAQPFIAHSIGPLGGWMAEAHFQGAGLSNTQFHWPRLYKAVVSTINDDLCHKTNQLMTENALYSIYASDSKTWVLLSTNKSKYCQAVS